MDNNLKNKIDNILEKTTSLDVVYCDYDNLLTLYKDLTGLSIYIKKNETQSISGGFKAAIFDAKGTKITQHIEKMTMKELLIKTLKEKKFFDALAFQRMHISTKLGTYKKTIEQEIIYKLKTRELILSDENNENIANLKPKYTSLELNNFLVNYKNSRFECSNINFNCDSVLVIYFNRPLSILEDTMFISDGNENKIFDDYNKDSEDNKYYLIDPLFVVKCY